jgi:hypothetical protein
MPSAAEKIQFSEAFLEDATVVGREGPAFAVRAGNRRLEARRATGCLVEPEEGDRVLLAWIGDDRFILSVLSREAPAAPTRLSVEGDMELRVPGGRFVVASQEGIDLTTAGETSVTTGALHVNAVEGKLVVQTLEALGERIEASFSHAKLVAERVDSVFERLHQRIARSYRFVREMDQLRAGHIDYRAEHVARVHAENAVITADDVVKVDGAQVHIG